MSVLIDRANLLLETELCALCECAFDGALGLGTGLCVPAARDRGATRRLNRDCDLCEVSAGCDVAGRLGRSSPRKPRMTGAGAESSIENEA